ncbi:hypothetical protein CJ738_36075, partial [Klebsiella pneumoniae]
HLAGHAVPAGVGLIWGIVGSTTGQQASAFSLNATEGLFTPQAHLAGHAVPAGVGLIWGIVGSTTGQQASAFSLNA